MTETYAHTADPAALVASVPPPVADDGIPDFTRKRPAVQFRLNGQLFTAVSAVPAQVMIDFASKFAGMDPATVTPQQQLSAFSEVLEVVLPKESLDRLNAMLRDKETPDPVDLEQVDQIIGFLFEKYGLRPTPQPDASAPGLPLPEYGTSSTDSAQVAVSIPLDSPSTAS